MAYQPKSYKKFVATAATATLVASAIAPVAFADSSKFTDVTNKYKDAVDFVVSKGANGLTATTFGVDANIKRVDAAVLLVNVLGLDIESAPASGLKDVPQRAVKHINALKAAGITSGKTPTTFDPDAQITRGELAIWISKAFELEGSNTTPFKDVSSTYTKAVSALVAAGITQGTSETTFGTTANAKRGDYAIFLQRAAGESTTPAPADLAIESVTALNDANSFLSIQFNKKVTDLETSDIAIKDAKTGATYGVKAVTLSKDGKTATAELYSHDDANYNNPVLKHVTNYAITIQANGKELSYTFNRPYSLETRVVDVNVVDKKIDVVDNKTGAKKTLDVLDKEFDYEGALGELVQVWFNQENELVKSQVVSESAQYDAIEVTKVDEIKLISANKKIDVSEEKFDNSSAEKIAFYVDGKKVNIKDQVGKKYNFAKVGYNKSGDIEFINAYNFKQFLIVDKVSGNEVVGIKGTPTGGSFDAKDATIIKDGKVIALSDLKHGDVLFFYNKSSDQSNKERYAEVLNNTVSGKIENVYSESIKVNGKTYDFVYDQKELAKFNVNYAGKAVYVDKNGKVATLDSDAAEELQAAGNVTLYFDRAGNLVYAAGDLAEVESNTKTSILTSNIIGYAQARDRIEVEAFTKDKKELFFDLNLKDLNTITIDGKDYDIDNDDTNASNDKYVAKLNGQVVELFTHVGSTSVVASIDLSKTKGQAVKLKTDNDGKNLKEIEFFSAANTNKEGKDTLASGKVLEAGDTYFPATSGSKLLVSDTVVFDATDGTDADDVEVSTWGAYKGSDIAQATVIYDEDNEAIAVVITATTTADKVFEEAVITNVLRNTDGKVVEIKAYVNSKEVTLSVDKVTSSIAKGDVAVLEFGKNNKDLVKSILTSTAEYNNRVKTGLTVDEVNVGAGEVTFSNGAKYKLVGDGAVINVADKNDIETKLLTDLRGKTNVTVVLDEQTGTFAKYFVYGVTAAPQPSPVASVTTATLTVGQDVTTVQSTQVGTAYLVPASANLTTKEALDAAVTAGTAKKADVTAVNTNTTIATTGLAAGAYNVVTVNANGLVSSKSAGTITLEPAKTDVAFEITSATATANSIAAELGLVAYKVEGTVASADAASVSKVKITFVKADGTESESVEQTVTNGSFAHTVSPTAVFGVWDTVKVSYDVNGTAKVESKTISKSWIK